MKRGRVNGVLAIIALVGVFIVLILAAMSSVKNSNSNQVSLSPTTVFSENFERFNSIIAVESFASATNWMKSISTQPGTSGNAYVISTDKLLAIYSRYASVLVATPMISINPNYRYHLSSKINVMAELDSGHPNSFGDFYVKIYCYRENGMQIASTPTTNNLGQVLPVGLITENGWKVVQYDFVPSQICNSVDVKNIRIVYALWNDKILGTPQIEDNPYGLYYIDDIVLTIEDTPSTVGYSGFSFTCNNGGYQARGNMFVTNPSAGTYNADFCLYKTVLESHAKYTCKYNGGSVTNIQYLGECPITEEVITQCQSTTPKNPYVKGTISLGTELVDDTCLGNAFNNNPLRDHWCSHEDGLANWEDIDCLAGCNNGACQTPTAYPLSTFVIRWDSNYTQRTTNFNYVVCPYGYTEQGEIYVKDGNINNIIAKDHNGRTISDGSMILCSYDDSVKLSRVESGNSVCPTGYDARGSFKIDGNIVSIKDYNRVEYGSGYAVFCVKSGTDNSVILGRSDAGSTTCPTGYHAQGRIKANDVKSSLPSSDIASGYAALCSKTSATPPTPPQPPQPQPGNICHDSDNGLNYYLKGKTWEGNLEPLGGGTGWDYCDTSKGANALVEYYCGTDEKVHTMNYECLNGCSDGACVGENPNPLPSGLCDAITGKTNSQRVPPRTKVSNLTGKYYCDYDLKYKRAKDVDENCDNDYECKTNACIEGKCSDIGTQIKEQGGLIRKIFCAIFNPIDFSRRGDAGQTIATNDYLACVEVSTDITVIVNQGFETGETGVPYGWTKISGVANSVTIDSSFKHSGSKSMKIVANNGNVKVESSLIAVVPNVQYNLSNWIAGAPVNNAGAGKFFIQLYCYKENGDLIAENKEIASYDYSDMTAQNVAFNTFVLRSYTFTPSQKCGSADAKRVKIVYLFDNRDNPSDVKGTAWVDDVYIRKISA